jgi:hypothetical protein
MHGVLSAPIKLSSRIALHECLLEPPTRLKIYFSLFLFFIFGARVGELECPVARFFTVHPLVARPFALAMADKIKKAKTLPTSASNLLVLCECFVPCPFALGWAANVGCFDLDCLA